MVGFFVLLFTCPAMAVTARRMLAKVKSSAMRPRQPEVPNLIGEGFMAVYSSPDLGTAKGRGRRETSDSEEKTEGRAVPDCSGQLRKDFGGAADCAGGSR